MTTPTDRQPWKSNKVVLEHSQAPLLPTSTLTNSVSSMVNTNCKTCPNCPVPPNQQVACDGRRGGAGGGGGVVKGGCVARAHRVGYTSHYGR